MSDEEWDELLKQLTPSVRIMAGAWDVTLGLLSAVESGKFRRTIWNVYYEGYANGVESNLAEADVIDVQDKLAKHPIFSGLTRIGKHVYDPAGPDGLSCKQCGRGRYHPAHRDELGNKL